MDALVTSFALGFAVIFIAELGDKSQLMAMLFATRYRPAPVLVGICLATTAVHALSVGVGHGLGAALPTTWITVVAGLAFLGFAGWTLRGDVLHESDRARTRRGGRSAVIAVATAFLLAELGDKTMLATVTLATQHQWFGVWVGSTVGMVIADAIAIAVGHQLAVRLPERVIRYSAASLFALGGLWLLVSAA
jgi:Ca2+/H+ antiporter, TMEM165/GDT1 family